MDRSKVHETVEGQRSLPEKKVCMGDEDEFSMERVSSSKLSNSGREGFQRL